MKQSVVNDKQIVDIHIQTGIILRMIFFTVIQQKIRFSYSRLPFTAIRRLFRSIRSINPRRIEDTRSCKRAICVDTKLFILTILPYKDRRKINILQSGDCNFINKVLFRLITNIQMSSKKTIRIVYFIVRVYFDLQSESKKEFFHKK